MQDAFARDMFSISDVNNPRYNGHAQVSPLGKATGGKRDRKGCTKGKIEAIMKNNIARPKVAINNPVKKIVHLTTSNHNLFSNHIPVKSEQEEDPYTFTEPEPQVLSLYQPSASSSTKKPQQQAKVSSSVMVCQEKPKIEQSGVRSVVKVLKAPPEGTSKLKKLEADIARNKVIGKRRKTGTEQTSGRGNDWTSKRDPGKVCISAKRKSTWQQERNSKHELLERIRQEKCSVQQLTRDLYPLGLEVSESESESEDAVIEGWCCWLRASPDPAAAAATESGPATESSSEPGRRRCDRIEESRSSLRRQLRQARKSLRLSEEPPQRLVSALLSAARCFPASTAAFLNPALSSAASHRPLVKGAQFLLRGEKCSYREGCTRQSLPSTRHCLQHIMYNVDQRLFSRCTAKHTDNTQCASPVFDVSHHLPLCHRHASLAASAAHSRLTDSRGKRVNKRSRSVLGSSKRNNKKRKKLASVTGGATGMTSSPVGSGSIGPRVVAAAAAGGSLVVAGTAGTGQSPPPPPPPPPSAAAARVLVQPAHSLPIITAHPSPLISGVTPSGSLLPQSQEVVTGVGSGGGGTGAGVALSSTADTVVEEVPVDEVLAIASALDPEVQQRLLEEHDFSTVFSQLSNDALNEILLDKNGEYEPTTEETEALERALEAVNNDVRSLETLSRGLPLLQLPLDPMTLLDEAVPPFPPFHNGFPPAAPPPAAAAATAGATASSQAAAHQS